MSDFITKDSGKREVHSTGMQRDTQEGKPRFDLIFPLKLPYEETMIYRWADLLARGAVKYDSRNWEQASTEVELERYKASAARHFAQWISGEDDEDHAAAVMFNLQGAEYVKWRMKNEVEYMSGECKQKGCIYRLNSQQTSYCTLHGDW